MRGYEFELYTSFISALLDIYIYQRAVYLVILIKTDSFDISAQLRVLIYHRLLR